MQKGWRPKVDGVVSATSTRIFPFCRRGGRDSGRGSVGNQHSKKMWLELAFFRASQHYPVFFHKLPLMKKSTPSTKGEFTSSAFLFLSQKVVLRYSPSVEGVATEGRRGSVVKHGKMLIQVKFLTCVADTTPSAIAATPSARRGILTENC